ncbi:mediator of RNA polymerase II transcription subunit 15-like [Acropora muricata]|uniref:mediator of RNA polymerase II transcription subunit 15-like n=1 Tax=Acropora muricata TaxID=159855 RepID=UPI0010FCA7EF
MKMTRVALLLCLTILVALTEAAPDPSKRLPDQQEKQDEQEQQRDQQGQESAPATDQVQQPMANYAGADMNQQFMAPSMDQQMAPQTTQQYMAPPMDQQMAPPMDQQFMAPPMSQQVAPPMDQQMAPPMNQQVAPLADQQSAPQADQQSAPPADKQAAPQMDQPTDQQLDCCQPGPSCFNPCAPPPAPVMFAPPPPPPPMPAMGMAGCCDPSVMPTCPNPCQPPHPPRAAYAPYPGEITMKLKQPWKSSLADHTSPAYKILSGNLATAVKIALRRDAYLSNIYFREGYVPGNPSTQPITVAHFMVDGGSDDASLLQQSVTPNESLGDGLKVYKDSFNAY